MNEHESYLFMLEASMWLPYVYLLKLMQAHQEFYEDLFYV
jgi:hypothetical protein